MKNNLTKKLFFLFFLISFAGQSFTANQFFQAVFAASWQEEKYQYLFWEITKDNNKAYILGSIHMAKKEIYPLKEEIEKAFEQSDKLVLEIDLSRENELEIAAKMLSQAVCPELKSLKTRLPEKIYLLAQQKTKELGLDIRMFEFYQPWFLAISITAQSLIELGFSPEWGVDRYFLEKAVSAEKKVKGLETWEFQISLFKNLSHELQELFLLASLAEIETIAGQIDVLFDAWQKGNKRRLDVLFRRSLRQYPELAPFYEKVVYQRNKNMAEKIESYLKQEGTYFVVVGAAHLIGEQGIIQILQNKGYRLNRR